MSEFIDIREYSIGLELGSGGCGTVFQAINKETNQVFAAKRISIHFQNFENDLRLIKREINILSQLIHPSIVKFFGFSPIDLSQNEGYIIMEYWPNGSLQNIIKEKEALTQYQNGTIPKC